MLTNLVNKPVANRRHLYEAGRRLGESGEKSGQFWSTFLLYIYIYIMPALVNFFFHTSQKVHYNIMQLQYTTN